MYCQLCKAYNNCNHYEPHKTYAEPYKGGYRLYHYTGGLRATGKRKLLTPIKFATKEEAILYSWKLKNNIA